MKQSAAELNDWLAANHQSAIDDMSRFGMTLRFVEGAENYHQDKPSLSVGAEGVGFTFQKNGSMYGDPSYLMADTVDRGHDFQQAFSAARQQYGNTSLPIARHALGPTPLMVRGQGWDIANHQTETTTETRRAQQTHWMRHSAQYGVGHENVSYLVDKLCKRQALYDRLRMPEGVLALVREPGSMDYREDEGAYSLKADKECLLMLGQADLPEGSVMTVEALYWASEESCFIPLGPDATAQLSADGIKFHSECFGSLTPSFEAKDLGMDVATLNAMVAMDMKPLDILQFDVAKAETETSASANFLAGLDSESFLGESQDQGFMR